MKKTLLYGLCIGIVVVGGIVFLPKEITYIEALYQKNFPIETSIKREVFIDESITIIAFGDMMFDRGVRSRMDKGVQPFRYFEQLIGTTTKEIVTANLEGPIIETPRESCQQKAYSFQFPTTTATLLSQQGFNLLNLANNHSYDCYQAGFLSTQQSLKNFGIQFMGGGNNINQSYTIKEVKGKKVAFVGIDMTVQTIAMQSFYPLIAKLNNENDFVIVQIHWGDEYNLGVTSTQKLVGHTLIDKGADIIIGHHPHVIEPMEIYKGKPIFYSLGNFIFDQIGENENKGLGVELSVATSTQISLIPFDINYSVPTPLSSSQKIQFCENYYVSSHITKFNGCEIIIE